MWKNRTVFMADFIKYFEMNNGYATVKELKSDGFHTSVIKKMADEGVIYKIKPGLYRLTIFRNPKVSALILSILLKLSRDLSSACFPLFHTTI
jgi:hypothetical protein